MSVVSVAEVINSRSVSNSRKELAIEPIGPLRAFNSMSTTCSNKVSAITISACAPATSKKYARSVRITKSLKKIMNTPTNNATNVSIALFGITLSYTIIEKPEVASANKLVSSAAKPTCK